MRRSRWEKVEEATGEAKIIRRIEPSFDKAAARGGVRFFDPGVEDGAWVGLAESGDRTRDDQGREVATARERGEVE